MKRTLGWVAIAVTAAFVLFNLEPARVWFLGLRVELPLGLVVIGSTVLGALVAYAFSGLKGK